MRLLSVRSALILSMAIFCGMAVGILSWMSERPIPEAVVAGICVAGGSAACLNRLIGS
jgi:hypothetical protein